MRRVIEEEADITRAIFAAVNRHNVLREENFDLWKTELSGGRRGWPDLTYMDVNGVIGFIECKIYTPKPDVYRDWTSSQRRFARRCVNRGVPIALGIAHRGSDRIDFLRVGPMVLDHIEKTGGYIPASWNLMTPGEDSGFVPSIRRTYMKPSPGCVGVSEA